MEKVKVSGSTTRPPPGIRACASIAASIGGDRMSNDKRWHDMTPDEQAVAIRQIRGAVNGLQFRVQDLEDAVKALQERLDKRGD